MRIYLSGKVTGTEDYTERFATEEEFLRKQGHSVVNPVKVNAMLPSDTTYDDYMAMSLCMLRTCQAIYMLSGYKDSPGAMTELAEAEKLNMPIFYQPPFVL